MGKESNIGSSHEEELAEEIARERGFTDEDISYAKTSLHGALGGVLKHRIEGKGYETEEFSEMSGIPVDELRGIYFGFVEPWVTVNRFWTIVEALEMDQEDIDSIREVFFKQEL